jgi:hypothetical protein
MALARWQATIVDTTGDIVASATVAVYSETTGALATIYSDRAGTVSITNPTTADSEGFVGFYAAGDAYRIVATSGSTSREFRYVGIGTSQEQDKQLSTIATTTFSGSANLIYGSLDSYKRLEFKLDKLGVSVDTASVNIFISINDGVSYIGGTSNLYTLDKHTVTTAALSGSAGAASLVMAENLGTGAGEFYQGAITMENHTDATTYKHVNSLGSAYDATPALVTMDMKGLVLTGGSVTNLAIQPSSGTISGSIVVKGELL